MGNKTFRKARLADIEVDEVSLVDKAANKRKFLFVKRDDSTSEDIEGGENLELLKAFKKDPDAISALESIEENLVKFDRALAKRLEDPELTDEERTLLVAKQEEYGALKEQLEDGFEQLFLDKKASKDAEDDEDTADNSADEEAEGEGKGEEPEPDAKKKFPFKGKKKATKKSDTSDEEDEDESEDTEDESEEEESEETETEVKKSDDESEDDAADDESEEESEDDDDVLDDEDKAVLAEIQTELEKGAESRKELSQIYKGETVPAKS